MPSHVRVNINRDEDEYRGLALTACETSDIKLLDEAIDKTAEDHRPHLYRCIRGAAIRNNSIAILNRLVERGVDISNLTPKEVVGKHNTSKETLEYLLAHGWDINKRQTSPNTGFGSTEPFMWHVVRDHDMVVWCLDHGASVHVRDRGPDIKDVIWSCPEILERAAAWASITTFELLRSKGAPLGWRPLHLAVETATFGHDDEAEGEKGGEKKEAWIDHAERMAMVRHLLDEVKLDVNALDQPLGSRVPTCAGTPICYIPGSDMLERDNRELTWLLLDHGADPTPAFELARVCQYPQFVEDVEAWKAQQKGDHKCCVQ